MTKKPQERKTPKTPQAMKLKVNLNQALADALRKLCIREGKSPEGIIRDALTEYVKPQE